MEEDEAVEVETRLRDIAEKHGLGWVVEQTEETVREGKSGFKRPKGGMKRDTDELVPAAITKERGTLETQPYSHSERVALYAQALRRVVADTHAAETEAAELLIENNLVQSVVFVDELDGQPTHRLPNGAERTQLDPAARERLEQALSDLQEQGES